MNEIKKFTDLLVWQHFHKIILLIYTLTKQFPDEEKFGLTNQTRRSASSIAANIAEGFGRFHPKDKVRFYIQARASGTETQNHIILAKDLRYLSEKDFHIIEDSLIEGQRMLNGLINSINSFQP